MVFAWVSSVAAEYSAMARLCLALRSIVLCVLEFLLAPTLSTRLNMRAQHSAANSKHTNATSQPFSSSSRPSASSSSIRAAAAASSIAAATVATASVLAKPAAPAAVPQSRAARLEALRAQRDSLQSQITSQKSSIAELEKSVAELRLHLTNEVDSYTQSLEDTRVSSAKSTLLQAFLTSRSNEVEVWKEYLTRLKQQGRLEESESGSGQEGAATAGGEAKFFDTDGQTRTRHEQALLRALAALKQSFLSTLAQTPEGVTPDSDSFEKITPETVEKKEEYKAAFLEEEDGGRSVRADVFLRNLMKEMTDESKQIKQRAKDLKEGKGKQAEDQQQQQQEEKQLSNSSSSSTSVFETLSSLISSLQSESSSRFIQAQKLANETAAQNVLLDELIRKQREKDPLILDAAAGSDITMEQKQHLTSVRRLQDLHLSLAALKSQLAFAKKTYDTFKEIAEKRQAAWDVYEVQRDAVSRFSAVRKSNEQVLVALVLANKQLRRKMKEYEERERHAIRSNMIGLCDQISSHSAELGNVILKEMHAAVPLLSESPFSSSLTSPRHKGGEGRTPLNRFALHQVQRPSSQFIQLHSVLLDPFGSVGTDAPNATFKGWRNAKVYANPTALMFEAQEKIERGLHLSHLHRSALATFYYLSRPTLISGYDVLTKSAWRDLDLKVREFLAKQDGVWSETLRTVATNTKETQDLAIPRLHQLLRSFWLQPAMSTIPHLRNQLGLNIDDYVEQMRGLVTQIHQQETRYNRTLKQRLMQPL